MSFEVCVYFDTIWPYEGSDYVIVGGYDLMKYAWNMWDLI